MLRCRSLPLTFRRQRWYSMRLEQEDTTTSSPSRIALLGNKSHPANHELCSLVNNLIKALHVPVEIVEYNMGMSLLSHKVKDNSSTDAFIETAEFLNGVDGALYIPFSYRKMQDYMWPMYKLAECLALPYHHTNLLSMPIGCGNVDMAIVAPTNFKTKEDVMNSDITISEVVSGQEIESLMKFASNLCIQRNHHEKASSRVSGQLPRRPTRDHRTLTAVCDINTVPNLSAIFLGHAKLAIDVVATPEMPVKFYSCPPEIALSTAMLDPANLDVIVLPPVVGYTFASTAVFIIGGPELVTQAFSNDKLVLAAPIRNSSDPGNRMGVLRSVSLLLGRLGFYEASDAIEHGIASLYLEGVHDMKTTEEIVEFISRYALYAMGTCGHSNNYGEYLNIYSNLIKRSISSMMNESK